MTPQQAFDRAVVALIRQGRPSYDKEHDSCLYRGPEGTKCALGHLIDDEALQRVGDEVRREYEKQGRAVPCPVEFEAASTSEIARAAGMEDDGTFAAELQSCHDEAIGDGTWSQFIVNFITNCEQLCLKFRLDPAAMKLAYDEYLASQKS